MSRTKLTYLKFKIYNQTLSVSWFPLQGKKGKPLWCTISWQPGVWCTALPRCVNICSFPACYRDPIRCMKCTIFIMILGVTLLMTWWKFVRSKYVSQFEVLLLQAQHVYLIYYPVPHIHCKRSKFTNSDSTGENKYSRLMSKNVGFSKRAPYPPHKKWTMCPGLSTKYLVWKLSVYCQWYKYTMHGISIE